MFRNVQMFRNIPMAVNTLVNDVVEVLLAWMGEPLGTRPKTFGHSYNTLLASTRLVLAKGLVFISPLKHWIIRNSKHIYHYSFPQLLSTCQ